MRLVTFTRVNKEYFAKGSGPKKAEWADAIDRGEINGKVGFGKVYVDIDDFLSRDKFAPANDDAHEMDLLNG